MKKSSIISAFTAILMMAVTPAFAQEEHGFDDSVWPDFEGIQSEI